MRSIFSRRVALGGLAAIMTLALAACGGGDDNGDGGTATQSAPADGGTATVEDGVVEISADDLAFSASVIEAPAGEAFTIVLNNLEDVPHNISVFTEEGGEAIVRGEIISTAGSTTEVEVPALDAGEYFFVCDVHPTDMTGTLVVEG